MGCQQLGSTADGCAAEHSLCNHVVAAGAGTGVAAAPFSPDGCCGIAGIGSGLQHTSLFCKLHFTNTAKAYDSENVI